ncbi:hypothetical protein BO71DRAFT_430760 [Aspergillus ellipticus CBS 707.79]|uniref:Uncharacterized protein n=1 Tax=Aspergillus ellipticus CBS 707.79 TaxID=1448320 RepID=A0A319D927_9EURO|nr:hypothetical protein BO71DRAFT_430760 [Aspergillus ellipticus CBS 707.79]
MAAFDWRPLQAQSARQPSQEPLPTPPRAPIGRSAEHKPEAFDAAGGRLGRVSQGTYTELTRTG